MTNKIHVKGIQDSLLISLPDGEWDDLMSSMLSQIDQQMDFYKGARVAIDVGSQILKARELGTLRDKISDRGLNLWAIISQSPTTETTAQTLGLATRISKPEPQKTSPRVREDSHEEDALFIRRTLRSGNSIQSESHVTLLGDLNPGAEIISYGNIIVWGKLRGTVHAGANGNQSAVICALDISPTQLRIADLISVSKGNQSKPVPEIAYIENDSIVIKPWT